MSIQYDLEKVDWVIDMVKEGLELDESKGHDFFIINLLDQIKNKIGAGIHLSRKEENTIKRHLEYYPMRIYQTDETG